MEVELLAVDRGLVDLEVAGVDQHAERRVDGQPDAVRHAVRDAQELDLERADLDDVLRPDGPEGVVGEIVFVELGADERQRQRRAVDRTIDVRQQVGDGPDVVFVPVREHERGDAALLQVGEVGNDEVDAEELDVGERHPGVDDETRVPVRNRHEVHAEFAEAAQRDDFESRVAGERVAVPGRGARHRSSLHGAAGGSDRAGLARRPHSVCARRRTRTRTDAGPSRGSRDGTRGDATAGLGAGIASDRAAGTVRRRGENRANYSTESGISVSARRTNSAGVSVSGRRVGSMPVPARTAARSTADAGGRPRQRPQRVRQRLAALLEGRPHQAIDRLEPRHRDRRRPEGEPDDRRMDLRRRPEGARRQRQHAASGRRTGRASPPAGRSRRCPGRRRRGRRPRAAASRRRRGPGRWRGPGPGSGTGSATTGCRAGCRRCGPAPSPGGSTPASSRARKSPVTSVSVGGAHSARAAARSRSTSMAWIATPVAASGRVSAPRPGPISTKTSSGRHAEPADQLVGPGRSRKCWPKRLRARCLGRVDLGVRRVGDGVAGLAARLALRVARTRGAGAAAGRRGSAAHASGPSSPRQ